MRICIVSLSALPYFIPGSKGPFGGAEAQSVLLARTLAERGHEVSVVLTNLDGTKPHGFPGVDLIHAYSTTAGLPGIRFFVPRWRGLDRALSAADADVYLQMCAGAATGQVSMHCRRRGKPFVFATASDTDVVPEDTRLLWKDKRLYQYGLRHADVVVTQHARQARLLEKNCGLSSTPIGLGVDVPPEVPEPESPPMVLWLGTFREVKQPHLWVDVAKRFPQTRFEMVGGRSGTEPSLFDEIENRCRSIPNIRFVGPADAIDSYVSRAWALLNTSRVEGFPTTFLEAWARGVPTISFFDPDGLAAQNNMGWVAESPDELKAMLAEALASREQRDAVGRNGRDYVSREHALPVVAERMEEVFQTARRTVAQD